MKAWANQGNAERVHTAALAAYDLLISSSACNETTSPPSDLSLSRPVAAIKPGRHR